MMEIWITKDDSVDDGGEEDDLGCRRRRLHQALNPKA